jgi:hypothetical protein
MTAVAPVAYSNLMGVAARERGGGIGAALAARAHREIDAAGVAGTLLEHAPPKPLSTRFWAMQGYRPPSQIESRAARRLVQARFPSAQTNEPR